jgi:PBP1b-binding outer membrane lipoprotein LpoB
MKKIILTIGLVSIIFSGCASKDVQTGMSKADYNRANNAATEAFENLDKEFEKNSK